MSIDDNCACLTDERNDTRYVIPEGLPATVTTKGLYQKDEVFPASIVNLSQRGAKLCLPTDISNTKSVHIKLSIERLGMEFYVTGDVLRTEPTAFDDKWILGCALNPPLPESIFEILSEGGRLDRRYDPRFDDCEQFAAHCTLDNDTFAVNLRNYSNGGLCICSERPTGPDKQLTLKVKTRDLVFHVLTRWQLKMVDSYFIGCSSLTPDDHEQMLKDLSKQDHRRRLQVSG